MYKKYDLTVSIIQDVKCYNCQQLENESLISERIDYVDFRSLNKSGYMMLHEIGILDNDKILEYMDIQNIKAGDIVYVNDMMLKCTVIFDGYISLTPLDKYLYKPLVVDHNDYLLDDTEF